MAQRGGQWQQPEYGQPQHMSGQPPQHAPQPQHAQQRQPPQAYGQPPPPQGYGGPGGYGAPAAGDYGGRSSPDPWNAQQLSYQQQQQQYHQQQFARQRAQQQHQHEEQYQQQQQQYRQSYEERYGDYAGKSQTLASGEVDLNDPLQYQVVMANKAQIERQLEEQRSHISFGGPDAITPKASIPTKFSEKITETSFTFRGPETFTVQEIREQHAAQRLKGLERFQVWVRVRARARVRVRASVRVRAR